MTDTEPNEFSGWSSVDGGSAVAASSQTSPTVRPRACSDCGGRGIIRNWIAFVMSCAKWARRRGTFKVRASGALVCGEVWCESELCLYSACRPGSGRDPCHPPVFLFSQLRGQISCHCFGSHRDLISSGMHAEILRYRDPKLFARLNALVRGGIVLQIANILFPGEKTLNAW